jgi:hypothetical protein
MLNSKVFLICWRILKTSSNGLTPNYFGFNWSVYQIVDSYTQVYMHFLRFETKLQNSHKKQGHAVTAS